MNTKMLMLGILLLAGLSFAAGYPNNWMTNSVNRFGCNYNYNDEGWGCNYGLYEIAEHYNDEYWDFEAMDGYLDDMFWAIWDDGSSEMCEYSGCWGEPSVTDFRSSMLAYNVAAAGYRAEFLAGLRAYLADGGDRELILGDLQGAREGYMECLEDASEDGPCYACNWA